MPSSTKTSIDDVPDEILSGVFLLLVQEESFYKLQLNNREGPPRYPWLLAQVCNNWRRICLEYTRLWAYINFTWHKCPEPLEVSGSSCLAQARLHLERTGAAPLFVYGPTKLCDCEDILSTWKALSPHSTRWKDVRFGYGEEQRELWKELLSDNTGFSNIAHFEFQSRSKSEKFTLPFPDCNASELFNLRFLTLGSVFDQDEIQDFRWYQLTCLAIGPSQLPITTLFKILAQCTNLAHFDLNFSRHYHMEDLSDVLQQDSIVLPSLLSLTLPDTEECMISMLSFLRLPSLRCLKADLVDATQESSDSVEILIDFLRRSSCVLTEFNFVWHGSAEELTGILEMLPQVQILKIEGDVGEILRALGASTSICPSLQRLSMIHPRFGTGKLTNKVFIKLMESRRADSTTAASFKSLRFIYCYTSMKQRNIFRFSFERATRKYTDEGFELGFFSYKPRHYWQPDNTPTEDPDDYLVTPRIIHSSLS